MIAILDYKAGNQTSVLRALTYLGIAGSITNEVDELARAEGIIFPGVGSAAQAMAQLTISDLEQALRRAVEKKQPLLGICLGSQILLEESEEGPVKTLGIIKGKCKLFQQTDAQAPIRIPHMGWNNLKRTKETRLLRDIPEQAEFYFVHSYYNEPDPELVLAETTYGHDFCSVYGRDGLWAVQFHPEKSGKAGLQLLANFNDYCREKSQCSLNG